MRENAKAKIKKTDDVLDLPTNIGMRKERYVKGQKEEIRLQKPNVSEKKRTGKAKHISEKRREIAKFRTEKKDEVFVVEEDNFEI